MSLINDSVLNLSLQRVKSELDGKASTSTATSTTNGLMSSTDKLALDALLEDPFAWASKNLTLYKNAAFHNSIYRGKNLGTAVTDAQWTAITSGTFEDLFIGDYWTLNGEKKVIAHFDYYMNCGDSNFTKHHIIVINGSNMTLTNYYDYSENISSAITVGTTNYGSESATGFRWNGKYTEDGTWSNYTGLYINSHIYNDVLPAAQAKVEDAIGSDHLLWVRELLPSAWNSSTGAATSWAWTGDATRKLNLCSESQVYGHQVWTVGQGGSGERVNGHEDGIDKIQFALFSLCPTAVDVRAYWWLRSVASAAWACYVSTDGCASSYYSLYCLGVRPREIWG